eukprot:4190638-Lingulodinium_polyedra.AAC.1
MTIMTIIAIIAIIAIVITIIYLSPKYLYLYDHPTGDEEVGGGAGFNVSQHRTIHRSHIKLSS